MIDWYLKIKALIITLIAIHFFEFSDYREIQDVLTILSICNCFLFDFQFKIEGLLIQNII